MKPARLSMMRDAVSRVRLRTVLFHHVADADSSFTEGLDVRMGVDVFRSQIAHLARRYHPVSLDEVRHAAVGGALPPRALLVTIDDAYATVAAHMAPILDEFGVPSVFFVNGGFIDHQELNIDNLVYHTVNCEGGGALERALGHVRPDATHIGPAAVLADLVPTMTLDDVGVLREALGAELGHDPLERAGAEPLYLTSDQLRALPPSMAIGSHTRSHVRCRMLAAEELAEQIDGNRRLLAEMVGGPIDAFSVPYGSHRDHPAAVAAAIRAAGHDTTFLVEGQLNHGSLGDAPLLRVSMAGQTSRAAVIELEILPRLRHVRDTIRGLTR